MKLAGSCRDTNFALSFMLTALLALTTLFVVRHRFTLPRPAVMREVTIQMRNVNPGHVPRQTYYLMALRNEAGEEIASPTALVDRADVVQAAKVVNDGHGLWCDLPAMGDVFQLKLTCTARLTGSRQLILYGAKSVTGSLLEVTVDGRRQVYDLHAAAARDTFSISLRTGATPSFWIHRFLILTLAAATLVAIALCLAARRRVGCDSLPHDRALAPPRLAWIGFVAIVLLGVWLRSRDFSHDVDGMHGFRQSMIAANVEYMVRDGITITAMLPTKNETLRIYDFPLYQQIATLLCRVTGAEVMPVCRALSIAIYVLTALVILLLLAQTLKFPLSHALLAVGFYTISPLTVFYNRTPLPDNLAVLLAFASLWAFLRWYQGASHPRLSYLLMLLGGAGATLIKNPIYLPVCVVMAAMVMATRQWRRVWSPGFIVFGLVIGACVFLFKLYVNVVNTGTFASPAWEHFWYFSSLKDRMTLAPYVRLGSRFYTDVASRPSFFLALGALVALPWMRLSLQQKTFLYALTAGSILTMLVFFNVNWIHNYYQLPYVVVVSALSATAVHALLAPWQMPGARRRLPWHALLGTLLIFLICACCGDAIPRSEPLVTKNAGSRIRTLVPEDGYVIYVTPDGVYWNPIYHYYAKREGYNVAVSETAPQKIREITARFAPEGHPVYLFVPALFLPRTMPLLKDAFPGASVHPEGAIFRVR